MPELGRQMKGLDVRDRFEVEAFQRFLELVGTWPKLDERPPGDVNWIRIGEDAPFIQVPREWVPYLKGEGPAPFPDFAEQDAVIRAGEEAGIDIDAKGAACLLLSLEANGWSLEPDQVKA